MRRNEAGFTMAELMVALVITGLVGVSIARVFTMQQRVALTQVETANLQGNLRLARNVVMGELLQLGPGAPGGADLISMGATTLRYRGMRTLGLACQVSATEVRIRNSPIYSPRGIVAGRDSMLVFVESNASVATDDSWAAFNISAVNAASTCGAASATALTTAGPVSVANVVLDAPVRTYEVMELGPVTSGGLTYLGARSVSGGQTLTPVVGPITAAGLSFVYMDSLGNVTATAARVRSIQITLRGVSNKAVRRLGTSTTVQLLQDSVTFAVSVRNAPLP